MPQIAKSIIDLIGRTPLLELRNYAAATGAKGRILAKLESFNPGGSIKDRAAIRMIEAAEKAGALRPGGTIIEPTSGNTGIGLAMAAAAKGYKAVLTMPDTMSVERRKLLQAYGARIVLTPGAKGMPGAIAEAERLCASTPGAIMPQQFSNPANPEAHLLTTGPEIWADTDGEIYAFVSSVGTAGTVTGIGRFLKSKDPQIMVIAVEPAESPVLNGGQPGPHKIQGIGAGFIPENYDRGIVDKVMDIAGDEAIAASRMLARTEGVLAGISSGAALAAATAIARTNEAAGKNIVVILPDTGERYLSTELFDFE